MLISRINWMIAGAFLGGMGLLLYIESISTCVGKACVLMYKAPF